MSRLGVVVNLRYYTLYTNCCTSHPLTLVFKDKYKRIIVGANRITILAFPFTIIVDHDGFNYDRLCYGWHSFSYEMHFNYQEMLFLSDNYTIQIIDHSYYFEIYATINGTMLEYVYDTVWKTQTTCRNQIGTYRLSVSWANIQTIIDFMFKSCGLY